MLSALIRAPSGQRIITDLAVLDITAAGLVLRELAPGCPEDPDESIFEDISSTIMSTRALAVRGVRLDTSLLWDVFALGRRLF